METLLSHALSNLSSPTPNRIRKGVRQLEALLAQICLSKPPTPAHLKRHSLLTISNTPTPQKKLSDLPCDPAYKEFYRLQDGFQWNCAMRLVGCLERLLGRRETEDLLIVSTLDVLQGVLLLHSPSRELFGRELYMNVRTPQPRSV
jgi:hypothetical protein